MRPYDGPMSLRCVLALPLVLLAGCGSYASGPSPVHSWVTNGVEAWLHERAPDAEWLASGGGGGGGNHYASDYHFLAKLSDAERGAVMGELQAEVEAKIIDLGGSIGGRGTGGDPPTSFDFDYRAGGAAGGIVIHSIDGADGWVHILLVAYEVR